MGIGPFNGVSQKDNQFGTGEVLADPFRSVRMKEIVGARFSGEKRAAVLSFEEASAQDSREITPIPGEPFVVIEIEKVDFFSEGGGNMGMLGKIIIEGCGSTALRSDDHIIGQFPHPCGDPSEFAKSVLSQNKPFLNWDRSEKLTQKNKDFNRLPERALRSL